MQVSFALYHHCRRSLPLNCLYFFLFNVASAQRHSNLLYCVCYRGRWCHHPPVPEHPNRYDVVCPMRTAWDLHRAFPEAEFVLNDTCGHSAGEAETTKVLVGFADRWRDHVVAEGQDSVAKLSSSAPILELQGPSPIDAVNRKASVPSPLRPNRAGHTQDRLFNSEISPPRPASSRGGTEKVTRSQIIFG